MSDSSNGFGSLALRVGVFAMTVAAVLLLAGTAVASASQLTVPVYKQGNPQWGNDSMGGGVNLASDGCAVTCCAMAADYFGSTVNPGTLCDALKAIGGLPNGYLVWEDVPAAAATGGGTISYSGAANWQAVAADLGRIRTEIDAGFPVIVQTYYPNGAVSAYTHYVIITGYSGSTFYINDPLYGEQTTFNTRYGDPSAHIYYARFFHGTPHQVIPPRYNPVAPGDAGFTKGGTYWWSSGVGLYGSGLYTYCNGSTRDSWGRWTFDLSKLNGTAIYKVEAYIPTSNATTHNAHYHINTASGLAYHSVDQYQIYNAWTDLGTYTLNQGSAWVELDDATGETYVSASSPKIGFDAVRLTYVGQPVTPVALGVVGPVTFSSGPYSSGAVLTGSFTVKNAGGQTGTWAPLVLALRGPSGENRDAVAASSITLAAGESRAVTFSQSLDLVGNWTGFVSGQLSGGSWQSPSGATVAFTVAADTTSPSTTISGVPGSWTNATVSFSLSSSDNSGGSGVKAIYYTANGSQSAYSGPVSVSTEGVTTVTYWAVDNSNNAEGAKSTTIRIDKTAPATSDDHIATYAGSATIHLSASDARSGVAHTYYTLNGLPQTEGSTVAVGGANTYTLAYWSVDAAGNAEVHHVVYFTIALPKATVYTPVAPSTMYRGHSYSIYGYVAPRHTSGTYLVTLKFYKRNSSGTYVYHHSVNARRYYYSTAKTKYKVSVSLPHTGKWRVRAYHSCNKHAGSYSGYDYITVR